MSKFEDDERFDGLYLNVANTTRGIEPLLDTVFSFLRRKTDFFDGPGGAGGEDGQSAAFQMVNAVYQKHAERYRVEKGKAKKKSGVTATKSSSPTKSSKVTTEKAVGNDDGVVEMGNDGGFDISGSDPTKQTTTLAPDSTGTESPKNDTSDSSAQQQAKTPDEKKDEANNDADKDDKESEKPPLGNGGTVPGKYVWTQTLEEVSVSIPVPEHTRGRDLNVTIARSHLKVGLRSQPKAWIVNDDLTKSVKVDDSFWTVEDGNRLVVNLQKVNQMEWWDSVCAGDPKIDVKKIQPENSSLGDLDGETRKTVEKMMFDQRQKALGLPTSEDQTKLDALERIKKAHPELDFSQAKFS